MFLYETVTTPSQALGCRQVSIVRVFGYLCYSKQAGSEARARLLSYKSFWVQGRRLGVFFMNQDPSERASKFITSISS